MHTAFDESLGFQSEDRAFREGQSKLDTCRQGMNRKKNLYKLKKKKLLLDNTDRTVFDLQKQKNPGKNNFKKFKLGLQFVD